MGRLGSISPEFAGKQGHVSGFLRGHTEGSVLPHGQIDAACLHVAWEICLCFSTGMSTVCCCWIQTLMLLSSETEWAFPAFWRGGRGCSAAGWHDEPHKHFNECCLGQWWHLKSHFLNLELSEHFPWKGAFWRKYIYVTDLPFHTHRSPKNTASTAIVSPGLYKWDWAEFLFSACPYSADPLRFPQMVPQSSSNFSCSSDSQLLSVFLLRRVPGIFQVLCNNRVGDGRS